MTVHTCPRCLKEFNRKDYLVKHLQRKNICKIKKNSYDLKISNVERNFECKYCGKEYKNQNSLYRHIN